MFNYCTVFPFITHCDMAGAIFQKSKLVTGSLTTISNRYFFCKKSKAKFLKNVGIVKKLVVYYIFNLLLNVPNFLKNCNNYVTYAHYFTYFKKYLASNIMVPFFCHIKRSSVKKNFKERKKNSSADFDLAFFYIIIMLKLESDFKDFIRHFFP